MFESFFWTCINAIFGFSVFHMYIIMVASPRDPSCSALKKGYQPWWIRTLKTRSIGKAALRCVCVHLCTFSYLDVEQNIWLHGLTFSVGATHLVPQPSVPTSSFRGQGSHISSPIPPELDKEHRYLAFTLLLTSPLCLQLASLMYASNTWLEIKYHWHLQVDNCLTHR